MHTGPETGVLTNMVAPLQNFQHSNISKSSGFKIFPHWGLKQGAMSFPCQIKWRLQMSDKGPPFFPFACHAVGTWYSLGTPGRFSYFCIEMGLLFPVRKQ